MGFYAGKLVPVERVNYNTERKIYEEQEDGLPDDGAGLGLWFGDLGRLWLEVSHYGHGRGCLATVESTRFLGAGTRGSELGR